MHKESLWSSATYKELRQMADSLMSVERSNHTLQATGLVHEAWLRLLKSRNAESLDRGAFLGLAAQTMRRILTEHARRRASDKHGGSLRRTTISGKSLISEPQTFALNLDVALNTLEANDPELARVVELRFYGDCSVDEIATTLDSSPRTIKRRYRYAKAWLQTYMQEHAS
ncbi:MAG: RNA polymerase sigma factor (TIGR02999 family) [Planctomycetota bacterium]|jgi:RNA polymerase sigma factor (TIGR02999 family)